MKITESAGGVVLNPSGEILVVNQNGDSWSLPKGHLEPGEDALTAARREIYEEAGIRELHFIKDLGSYERPRIARGGGEDPKERKRITLFLFETPETVLAPKDPHHPEARWVLREEVPDLLTHSKDKAFFLKILKRDLKR